MSSRPSKMKRVYLLVSDFDQTLSLNDSGVVLTRYPASTTQPGHEKHATNESRNTAAKPAKPRARNGCRCG